MKDQRLLLEASADAGLGLGRIGDLDGVEIIELGLVEGDLGVAGLMVDLHRLKIGSCNFAVGALQLRVTALVLPQPVGLPGFSAAAIGGGRVDLGGDFFRGVLLGLSLPRHLLLGKATRRLPSLPPSLPLTTATRRRFGPVPLAGRRKKP